MPRSVILWNIMNGPQSADSPALANIKCKKFFEGADGLAPPSLQMQGFVPRTSFRIRQDFAIQDKTPNYALKQGMAPTINARPDPLIIVVLIASQCGQQHRSLPLRPLPSVSPAGGPASRDL